MRGAGPAGRSLGIRSFARRSRWAYRFGAVTDATRLTPPVARRDMLLRRRLLAQLQARWQRRLVSVVAGPGFGKTVLLAQAVEENRLAPRGVDLWLSCGPDSATVSSLASGLRDAVGASPGPDENVPADVAEAVLSRAPQQVALILDDAHEIPPGSSAADLLARVLEALPANGHLVVAGRTPPPFALARLDAHGDHTRVEEGELAFTTGELTDFGDLRDVPADRLATVEGWPALAELAVSVGASGVADFMWQEVLGRMAPEDRTLLAQLVLLPCFDAELAAAVAGRDVDLDAVTANLPMVMEGGGGEQTLHSLWGPVLERELTPEAAAETQRRAAAVFASRGATNTAVRLLLDAEAWDDVQRQIVRACGAAHPPVAADILMSWFDRLPPAVRSTPEGRLLGVLASSPLDGDVASAAADLESVAEAFHAVGDAEGELAAVVQLGYLAWWRERYDILIGLVARVLDLESRGHRPAGPIANIGRAIMADTMADNDRVLQEIGQIPVGSVNAEWRSVTEWLRSMALLGKGYAREALEPAEAAVSLATGPLRAPAIGSRLHARWFTGHIDETLGLLPDMLADAHASGMPGYIAVAGAQGCVAASFVGDVDAAAGYLDAARAVRGELNPLTTAHLAMADAALSVARGDEDRATQVLVEEVKRHGIMRGLAASGQTRLLALWYVLLPETRSAWDGADFGPTVADARALARALVEVRERGSLEAIAGLRVPAPDVVRSHLPLPWVALLALGLVDAGRPEGHDLLDAIWPEARPAVRALAEESSVPAIVDAAKQVLGRFPAPPPHPLSLRVLGPIELAFTDGDGAVAAEWRRDRVRTLLLYLVLNRRASRERLSSDLWPDLDAAGGSRNLRVTLTYLHRVLEPGRGEGDAPFFIRQDGGWLELHTQSWLTVDLWKFEDLLDFASAAERDGAPSVALGAYEEALALWRGDPLSGVYDDWALATAGRLKERFVQAALRAGELLLARGDIDRALSLAQQALDVEPWADPAHRLIVSAHLARGDRGTARRALDRYRKLLSELGTTADEATLVLERLLDTGTG